MSRRVLLLAYHFPPIGGAGAQRNTKLARYLPELGYELRVITGPKADGHRWAPIDHSLSSEVEEGTTVYRIPGPEPAWGSGWRRRTERWLRLEWPWQRWWETHAVPLALEVGADADLVYCSLAPFATARAAATISRRLGKPLVLDLEDPWALDEMLAFETALHRRLELRAMRRALASADAIVMNTPESERRVLAAFPELAAKPITSIVNGYDAEDFVEPVTERADSAFRIVHTGTLHSEANDDRPLLRRLLGGAMDGVHVRTRSLIYLMQALDQLTAQRPDLERQIEIHLAGRLTPRDREVLGDSPLIREHGFLSHRDTIALIRSADLLFLPMHDVPSGRSVAIVPCKTYEYIGSGRPILAAVPDGDAREFLTEAGTADLVRPTDVDGMKAALLRRLDCVDDGLPPVKASPSLLRRLERRTLTSDLADFIEPMADTHRSSVPSVAVDAAIR